MTVTLRRSYLDDNAYYFGIILQVYRGKCVFHIAAIVNAFFMHKR